MNDYLEMGSGEGGNFWEDGFVIFIGVMVAWVYTYLKTCQLYALSVWSSQDVS
jgi:hypothetical protein